jgi:hypothetical protein
MKEQHFPPGWDLARVQRVLEHYENQTEEEAVAEDEAALADENVTMMAVPNDLVPEVLKLIERRRGA